MADTLYARTLAILQTRWHRAERIIDSDDVYRDLVAAGVQVPDGALGEVWTELVDRGLIRVEHYWDWVGTTRHGAVVITKR